MLLKYYSFKLLRLIFIHASWQSALKKKMIFLKIFIKTIYNILILKQNLYAL